MLNSFSKMTASHHRPPSIFTNSPASCPTQRALTGWASVGRGPCGPPWWTCRPPDFAPELYYWNKVLTITEENLSWCFQSCFQLPSRPSTGSSWEESQDIPVLPWSGRERSSSCPPCSSRYSSALLTALAWLAARRWHLLFWCQIGEFFLLLCFEHMVLWGAPDIELLESCIHKRRSNVGEILIPQVYIGNNLLDW